MPSFSKLKQIKEMRSQAKQMQNTLSQESITVEEKGVSLTMDGNQNLTKVDVAKDLLTPDKKQKLEEAFMKAHESAIKKVHRIMAQKIKNSGMDIPGLK